MRTMTSKARRQLAWVRLQACATSPMSPSSWYISLRGSQI